MDFFSFSDFYWWIKQKNSKQEIYFEHKFMLLIVVVCAADFGGLSSHRFDVSRLSGRNANFFVIFLRVENLIYVRYQNLWALCALFKMDFRSLHI